jgi:hypothetical protein
VTPNAEHALPFALVSCPLLSVLTRIAPYSENVNDSRPGSLSTVSAGCPTNSKPLVTLKAAAKDIATLDRTDQ